MVSIGHIVLVVGPSGAGKDTLISAARAAFAGDDRFVFPRRTITRQGDLNEDNVYLDEATFAETRACGDFLLAWDAHGCSYGISRDVLSDTALGRTVIVNVSRHVVETARSIHPKISVVLVTAEPGLLQARLAARGRDANIVGRLDRPAPAQEDLRPDIVILNEGSVRDSADAFIRFIAALDG